MFRHCCTSTSLVQQGTTAPGTITRSCSARIILTCISSLLALSCTQRPGELETAPLNSHLGIWLLLIDGFWAFCYLGFFVCLLVLELSSILVPAALFFPLHIRRIFQKQNTAWCCSFPSGRQGHTGTCSHRPPDVWHLQMRKSKGSQCCDLGSQLCGGPRKHRAHFAIWMTEQIACMDTCRRVASSARSHRSFKILPICSLAAASPAYNIQFALHV